MLSHKDQMMADGRIHSYNNCPSAPDAFGQQQTTTSYCNAAKA